MPVYRLVKDLWPAALLAVGVLVVGVLYPMWRSAVDSNLDARADPHHIAGNLYFVGTPDIASFLLTGPEGDVLIADGSERMAYKTIANIAQLGFGIKDVRILLASDPDRDGAGGLADLQKASGAELWASSDNADVIARGGRDDPSVVYTPYRLMTWAGILDYPAPRVDHRFDDGETIRLGPIELTSHITPGHSRGCTTWTFTVRDDNRDLQVVHRCDLAVPPGASLVAPEEYPGIRADFERSFRTLRSLPVDIWLTARGREYGRYRKYQESLRAKDAVAPFIDRDGYVKSIDDAEATFRKLLAEQQQDR
jgi:metallo-beta-lactamase class B